MCVILHSFQKLVIVTCCFSPKGTASLAQVFLGLWIILYLSSQHVISHSKRFLTCRCKEGTQHTHGMQTSRGNLVNTLLTEGRMELFLSVTSLSLTP